MSGDPNTDGQETAGLRIVPNKPIPDNVRSVLESHTEGLVICVDTNEVDSDIVVFSKFLNRGVLTSYLANLLQNILKTANAEQSHCNLEGSPTTGTKTHSC